MSEKVKIKVTQVIEIEHDGSWGEDDLLLFVEDMCEPTFPESGWTSEGLEEFTTTKVEAQILGVEVISDDD